MDMLREAIKLVSHELSEREVVTVEEIKRIATTILLNFYHSDPSADYEKIVDEIIESLCDEPTTINSLHFSEKLNIQNVEFRHIHTCAPTRELIGEAYDEYIKSKKILDSIDKMKEITDRFFTGYEVRDGLVRIYTKKRFRYGVFYSIIDDVERFLNVHERFAKNFEGEYVIVVPTENEITPFLRFFRNNSEKVKEADFRIWVANVDQMSIDPFIGYPKDFTLLKGFRNPKVASQINSLWREKIDKID